VRRWTRDRRIALRVQTVVESQSSRDEITRSPWIKLAISLQKVEVGGGCVSTDNHPARSHRGADAKQVIFQKCARRSAIPSSTSTTTAQESSNAT